MISKSSNPVFQHWPQHSDSYSIKQGKNILQKAATDLASFILYIMLTNKHFKALNAKVTHHKLNKQTYQSSKYQHYYTLVAYSY